MKTGTAKLLLIILLTLSLLQFGNQNNQAIPANSISNQLAGAMSSFRTFPELSWSIDHDHESTFQYADFIAPTATADILGGKWQTRSLSPNLLESSSWSWDLSAVGSSLSLTTTFATVAYVYAGDTNDANAFKDLLDGKGYVTDLMTLAQAIPGAFDDYDLIILADDTGWNNDWGMDITQINAINDSGKPILGLGEGGYAYFGQIDLEIGSTRPGNQGVHGNDGTIEVVNSTHPIFTSPTPITSAEPIDLYKSTRFVSTHFSSYPEDVDLLGKIPSSDHYPLLLEDDRYLLWGFREPPNGKMNQVGKDLFLNIVAYLSGVQFIDPIYIDEDSDFAAYGFPGDGSESNPYVIENYNIFNSTATLIHVENTTVHFEIRDNNLNGIDGSNDGIFLSRVVNGTISSNTIFNCQTGINLFHSHDNTITNNYITNNFGHGIFLDGSGSNTIDYNTISESGASTLIAGGTPSLLAAGSFGHGIYLDPSNENTITYNDIHDNSGSGVFLENSNQNVITVNAIHDNGEPEATLLMAAGSFGHGIYLDPSDHNEIIDNFVFDNLDTGIFLNDSDDTLITDNIVYQNDANGVLLLNASFNTIDNNTIGENGLSSGTSSALTARARTALAAGSFGHGIYLDPSNNNTITDNDVYGNGGSGVFLENSANNTISINEIHDNGEPVGSMLMAAGSFGHGIYLDPSDNNDITDNIVWGNLDTGIFLNDSDNTLVSDNFVLQNDANGIFLLDAEFNTIDNNTIGDNGLSGGTSSALTARARTALAAGSFGHGIYLDPSNNNTISNNNIYGNGGSGVFLESSSDNTISSNGIHDNGVATSTMLMAAGSFGHGIYLDPSNRNTIWNNTIWKNGGSGVFLEDSDYNTIDNNTIAANGEVLGSTRLSRSVLAAGSFGHGIYLDPSNHNNITNNVVLDNPDTGIFLNDSDDTLISENFVQENGASGVFLLNSSSNTIDNNTITLNGEAPPASSARARSTLAAGSFGHGIYLDPSDENTISNNTVSNNYGNGIFLEDSSQVLISENFVQENGASGVFLIGSSFNVIDNNTITTNGVASSVAARGRSLFAAGSFGHGIYLDPSPNNTISNNVIDNNKGNGIFLEESGDIMTFRNEVSNNTLYGINVTLGSGENMIILNNFGGNNEGGTSQGNDDGFDNLFRYNHWNDHNNTDNDDDFLADDPYFIDGGANSSDSTAVAEVIDYSDHYLFGVNIVFPNYHDKVTETVTITWLPAIDTRWDPINYTLEYSPDAGKEWVFLDEVEGWNTTSYVWDISHFKSGSRYKLRINATCSEGLTVSDTSGKFEIFKVKKRGFPKPDNPAGADALLYLSNEMVSSRTPGWSFIILVLSVIGTLAVRQLRRSSKD
ncbi:MAG: right-handed parallel beta-helix repeat-containing protein [Candidatus Heimdallarchaeota archaeon]